jgi:hypothetical protein
VSLTAAYLFLIVFFWTPPHFWALALVKQKDYGRVGVPMAPNVWGERETMRQMLFYTLIMIPVTLAPVTYGGLGLVYGVSAAVLGLWFLRDVMRVMNAGNFTKPAWTLYRNSLLYLALLFAAMAVDGVVPGARVGHDPIILRDPTSPPRDERHARLPRRLPGRRRGVRGPPAAPRRGRAAGHDGVAGGRLPRPGEHGETSVDELLARVRAWCSAGWTLSEPLERIESWLRHPPR